MLETRTPLLISAAAAMFLMAACTGAEAGFLCKRGFGGFQRSYNYTPPERISRTYAKAPTYQGVSKAANNQEVPKAASQKRPVENPPKSVTIASAKPAATADTAASTPTPIPVATPTNTCVVKEYLDTGAVQFRDTCTKEWAINSIDSDAKTSKIRSACLTKQNNQNGVVIFKDVCTGEWAMNTAKQMALANAQ